MICSGLEYPRFGRSLEFEQHLGRYSLGTSSHKCTSKDVERTYFTSSIKVIKIYKIMGASQVSKKQSGVSKGTKSSQVKVTQAQILKILLKCSVGIDVSKASLSACFSTIDTQQRVVHVSNKTFSNTASGHKALLSWAKRLYEVSLKGHSEAQKGLIPLCYLMEATGVYYEVLAYFLHQESQQLSVLVPNKVKNFAKSLDIKTKTDKVDAQTIAQMMLERQLSPWHPPSTCMNTLKHLTRERESLVEQKTAALNRLHALKIEAEPCKSSIKRINELVKFFDKQINATNKEINKTIDTDAILAQKVKNVTTIPGVGILVAATVIAETNGFENFNNRGQLVSYAGYDVVENQSGQMEGKTRISKKGNAHIRRILHNASLSAVRYIPEIGNLQQRVFNTTKIKMKGYVAAQRKLLILIYTLYKNDSTFIHNYANQNTESDANNNTDKYNNAG